MGEGGGAPIPLFLAKFNLFQCNMLGSGAADEKCYNRALLNIYGSGGLSKWDGKCFNKYIEIITFLQFSVITQVLCTDEIPLVAYLKKKKLRRRRGRPRYQE